MKNCTPPCTHHHWCYGICPDPIGFALRNYISLSYKHFNGQTSTDSCRQTVFCQVFFGLPTGAVPSITNLVHTSTYTLLHNRHCPFIPREHATSVCIFSSHPQLLLHLGVCSVQCWTVFLSGKHHTST